MSGPGKLTRRMERAIGALLSEPTAEKAAKKARVSVATLRRWQKLPVFDLAIRHARQAVLDGVVNRLVIVAQKAVIKLDKLCSSRDEGIALRACLGAIDRAARGVVLADHEERIRALEKPFSLKGLSAERNGHAGNGQSQSSHSKT